LLVSGCGSASTSQQTVIIIPTDTATGSQIDGTPCPGAMSVQNVDGTGVVYLSIQQQVNKGNALVLSLPGNTSQVVGLFQSQADLNSYISQHNSAHVLLYQQQMYPGPAILVLKQVKLDAYDLILLQGNSQGGQPNYDCRVAANDQVGQITQQVVSVHAQLQGVKPLELDDYKFTQPTDGNFT